MKGTLAGNPGRLVSMKEMLGDMTVRLGHSHCALCPHHRRRALGPATAGFDSAGDSSFLGFVGEVRRSPRLVVPHEVEAVGCH